jgi:hypothetical protein
MISILKWKIGKELYKKTVYFYSKNTVFSARAEQDFPASS